MSKRLALILLSLSTVACLLIVLIAINFSGIKEKYNELEPNLDNYSSAEVIYLSFERMKNVLLEVDNDNVDSFLISKDVFESKINILQDKYLYGDAFYKDCQFITLVNKLKQQFVKLDVLSDMLANDKAIRPDVLEDLNDIDTTLVDLQEVIYRIQIHNFNGIKKIIKDNSWQAEWLAILSLVLIFSIIALIICHNFALKKIIRDKNIFISSIYHELAGSTQSIIMAADIVEHDTIDDKLKNEVEIINYHAHKIIDQTREVMDFSRIEMKGMKVNLSAFFINDMIEDIMNSMRRNCGNEFKFYGSYFPYKIIADEYKLSRIVANLIDNANKYTEDGRVFINAKVIRNNVIISVKDNGCGFNMSRLKKLYRPFNQGARHETRQGLGLGLTIIKDYVRLLKGHIRVRSEKTVGSTFTVCIPVAFQIN